MIEIDGFKLEPTARPDYPESEHYWPCVRVTRAGCLDAVHSFSLRSLKPFNSRDVVTVLAAAAQATHSICSVTVRNSRTAR